MEIDQIHAFGWRKRSSMSWEKKVVTPRLAFPFCLKTAKNQGKFQKTQKCAFDILE